MLWAVGFAERRPKTTRRIFVRRVFAGAYAPGPPAGCRRPPEGKDLVTQGIKRLVKEGGVLRRMR